MAHLSLLTYLQVSDFTFKILQTLLFGLEVVLAKQLTPLMAEALALLEGLKAADFLQGFVLIPLLLSEIYL